MSSKVHSYLRTLRREWGLTQGEVATLLDRGKCGRNRVSSVERNKAPPNASEILAYSLIFGISPGSVFPRLAEEVEERVMRGACQLQRHLQEDDSPRAVRSLELIDQIAARATGSANQISEV